MGHEIKAVSWLWVLAGFAAIPATLYIGGGIISGLMLAFTAWTVAICLAGFAEIVEFFRAANKRRNNGDQ